MTAEPYIDRRYDDDPNRPDVAAGYDDVWDQGETPTVPQNARRRVPPKKDLAVRALTASLDFSAPLFVIIPTLLVTVGLSHWLPAGTLLKAGWIIGHVLVAVAAGFQMVQPNTHRRRALLALWVLIALGTIWMVAG